MIRGVEVAPRRSGDRITRSSRRGRTDGAWHDRVTVSRTREAFTQKHLQRKASQG